MSAHSSFTTINLSDIAMTAASHAALHSTMRRPQFQDFIFHKVTMLFTLPVLLAIIASLAIGAAPAFENFGPAFIATVEGDPVNDQYGALIAIAGTLATSLIALLLALPVSFGIALFLTVPEAAYMYLGELVLLKPIRYS